VTTALLVTAVVVALACPLHVLLRTRRRGGACCLAQPADGRAVETGQRELVGQLSQLSLASSERDAVRD
jgi:hypothetical protein